MYSKQDSVKYFDYRLFNHGNNRIIQPFEEGDVVILNGKFTYRKDYNGENLTFIRFLTTINK